MALTSKTPTVECQGGSTKTHCILLEVSSTQGPEEGQSTVIQSDRHLPSVGEPGVSSLSLSFLVAKQE